MRAAVSAVLSVDRPREQKLGCVGLYYLGRRGSSAAPLLARLLADPDPLVRRMADNALKAIGKPAEPDATPDPAGT